MARDDVTLNDLVAIAQRVGVKVVVAPSSHRGKLGRMGTVVGVTRHHTGTPNSIHPTEDYPDYQVVKEGRPGLSNSLSAFGLGRWEAIYVFSEFLSWHAGAWNWQGITDGNGHFLGIEAAGVGDWTPFQRAVYPRLCASALLFLDEGLDMMPRHLDGARPRGRKSDMANEWDTFRDEVAWFMAHPEHIDINYTSEEDDDMARFDMIRNSETGEIVLAAPGIWQHIPAPPYIALYAARGLIKSTTPMCDVVNAEFQHFRAIYLSNESNDEATLAELRKLSADEAARAAAS